MATRSVLDAVRTRIEPRALSGVEAAIYVGVSPSLFDAMVRDGRMPKAKRINTRTVWDRKRLDEAFEPLPTGLDDEERLTADIVEWPAIWPLGVS